MLFAFLANLLGAQESPEPTFTTDIAPILATHCIDCHHPEGIGPFPLVTYTDARRRARQMAEVVASRYMPPWKPLSSHSPPLQGDRSLDQATIELITKWAEAGAPPGDLSQFTPPEPPASGWTLGPPDLELTFPEPYQLTADGTDVFQNIVLRIPIDKRRYVRALEFLPESSLVIHHVVIAFDPTSNSRDRDAAEPGLGFSSMNLGEAINPNGHILGWTPGQVPYEAHPGTAFELTPGTDLVLQLHMQPSGKVESVSPRIGLHFTDEPPTRTGFVMLLREFDIDLPPGVTDYPIHESVTLPVDVEVLGLYPHAHYLGKDMRVIATLPDGTERWLLHIPDWDFNWQSDYRYEEPLALPAGTRVDMRYTYDNSTANPRNPNNPPVRVTEGWGSFDEMGSVSIQLLLKDDADLPQIEETRARYQIESGDDLATNFYNLAVSLELQQRWTEAVTAYESALTIEPDNAYALNNLAAVHERLGEPAEAIRLYRRALTGDATLVNTRLNIARLLNFSHRTDESLELLATGLEQTPASLELRAALAAAEQASGNAAAARDLLIAGLPWHGEDPRIHLQLGQTYLGLNEVENGSRHLETALQYPVTHEDQLDDTATAALHAEAAFTLALLARQQRNLPLVLQRLHQTLAFNPTHSGAHLLSAAFAIAQEDVSTAQVHLAALLQLPPAQRPTEDELVRNLPYPAGVHAFAETLFATGDSAAAQDLLSRRATEARANGYPDWADAMLLLLDQRSADLR